MCVCMHACVMCITMKNKTVSRMASTTSNFRDLDTSSSSKHVYVSTSACVFVCARAHACVCVCVFVRICLYKQEMQR